MKEENRNKLNDIFADLKQKSNDAKIESEKREEENKLFLADFDKICREIIEPIMNDTAALLKENNYSAYVVISSEDHNKKGLEANPNIKMEISKSGNFASNKCPHVMFIGDKISKIIQIHESTMFPNTGGHSGMKSEKYTINSLTKDVVEKEIIDSIESILTNKY